MAVVSRTISRGALIGAVGGVVAALGDYGALWLWLPHWPERAQLLARMIGIQAPLGAVAGALLGGFGALAIPLAERGVAPRLGRFAAWAPVLPFVLLAAPLLGWVAYLLFTGGSASRLPARPALTVLAFFVLAGGVAVALRLGFEIFERGRRAGRGGAVAAIAGIWLAMLLVNKIDQRVLPNQYGYLHAGLAIGGWLLACLGTALVAVRLEWTRRLDARGAVLGSVAIGAAVLGFGANLATLDSNPNVRVALFDPRAATSRTLMHALEPLLATGSRSEASRVAAERARAEAERRRRLASGIGLPTAPDAHVLLITVDALRFDHLGAYGYRQRALSPNLDALAAESLVFESAYAQAPHSSYSLCSLMTSEYLHETVDLGQPLPEATLASTLAAHGFRTSAWYTLGIFHTEGERLTSYQNDAFGFGVHDHGEYTAEQRTDKILEEVDRTAAHGEPRTFFWAHYFDTHEPYRSTELGTSDFDRYQGEIKHADREIGRLIREARRRLERDLIIVVTADHGEEFREHGGVYHGSTLYEEQVHVPLIVHLPDVPPRRIAAPVELVDLAPTLLASAEVPVPASMRGDDLRALALGRVDDLGPAFSAVISKRMVRKGSRKLIADLRFGLYELYDLAADPRERANLAGSRPADVETLRGEIYAWLDGLSRPPREPARPADPRLVALERGRLGDRRATPQLQELILDASAPVEQRREAGRILGRLADPATAPSLVRALHADEPLVAAEAAIALGRMYDTRGRTELRQLVHSEDPDLRVRAAVSLGRLRDRDAVPALIEALWAAPTRYEREEAVRWLGRLRDPRGVEPLLSLIPEFRIRYLTVIALGDIGDRRAYPVLAEMLDWEHHSNVRDNVVRALGQMADRRILPRVVQMATAEPDLKNTSETLVRLDAIRRGAVGGIDVASGHTGLRGFGGCVVGPIQHDWDYLRRTRCQTTVATPELTLSVPSAVANAPGGTVVVLAARRIDAGAATPVTVQIGPHTLEARSFEGEWSEQRWTLAPGALRGGSVLARLRIGDARLSVDHLLLIPKPADLASL